MNHVAIGKSNLTRSQSDDLIVRAIMLQPFIVASWRGGEPIVQGYGATAQAAADVARSVACPPDSEICSRVPGESGLVWRGLKTGKFVTIEHILELDD